MCQMLVSCISIVEPLWNGTSVTFPTYIARVRKMALRGILTKE